MTHQPESYIHMLNAITARADHAYVGTTLLLAGFLPSFFNSSTLSAVYFALLIPPAAWHCYVWLSKTIIPNLTKKKDK